MAILLPIAEYIVLLPFSKPKSTLFYLGASIAILAQILRTTAMAHAGSNFTHMVAYSHEPNHILITTGVYTYLRHPAYTGFYYWGMGMQIAMGNWVCLLGYGIVLGRFFRERIREEEEGLEEFFGGYNEYRERSFVLIPLL